MTAGLSNLSMFAEQVLRCPVCTGDALQVADDGLKCPDCNTEFAADHALGFATLMPRHGEIGAAKQDIQKWWGDLYEQLYRDTDRDLTPERLTGLVDDFEELMKMRRHLVAEEMPLGDLAGKRVLEIGPGGGGHSCLFKKYGAEVCVADITPERALSSVRKLSLMPGPDSTGFNADGENLPFRDGSFDVVYSNGVLHHAENTDRCISEAHRVLKPGGIAVIMLYSRHSATYWMNIAPRALLSGEIFRWPEPQWIGRLTEGKPKHGTTKNPFTRVYSKAQIEAAFRDFKLLSVRKSSFQIDNFALPRLSQLRRRFLNMIGKKPHPGGVLVYGAPYVPETKLELALGNIAGFAWNIVAEKPATATDGAADA